MRAMTLFLCSVLFSLHSFAQELSADEILKKADEIRNPSESFQMKVTVQSTGESDSSEFEVYLKGKNKTLVKTLLPRRDRGRNMLMLDESMWVFVPNLKREVRVSLAQKLTGQAANGDISRMRWYGDYDAKIVKTDNKMIELSLSSKKKGLTYDKLNLWVNKTNSWPQKAEYLTLTGKVLKVAFFQDYKMMAGGTRPSKILIQDAINEKDSSTLVISEMVSKDFPDSLFSRENLK